MKKDTRISQCNKIIETSILNLFNVQDSMNMDQFAIAVMESLMTLEREEYLKGIEGKDDKGNGYYNRSLSSLSKNSLTINIPRTRNGEFKPLTIELLNKGQTQVNELAIELYKNGLSTRNVSKILKNFFGENIGYNKVSELAETFNIARKAWEEKPLDEYYKVIYMDAMYQTLRRDDSYSKEAVHIITGVRQDNTRELLYIGVNPTEGSNSWEEAFINIKNRGVENIDLIVADGLTGLENKIHQYFPETQFQKCVVHKQRQILLKTRPKEKKEMADDLKDLFNNFDNDSTIEKANNKLKIFINKWQKKYPKISNYFNEEISDYYFTYIKFPQEARRMIYTTNQIENLNRKIRAATKNKNSFEKESRLLDYIFIIIKDFEVQNLQKYPVGMFGYWVDRKEKKHI